MASLAPNQSTLAKVLLIMHLVDLIWQQNIIFLGKIDSKNKDKKPKQKNSLVIQSKKLIQLLQLTSCDLESPTTKVKIQPFQPTI